MTRVAVTRGEVGPEGVAPEVVALRFVAALRAAGLSVSVGESMAFLEALSLLGFTDHAHVHAAGAVTMVKRVDQLLVFDQVFSAFWQPVAGDDSSLDQITGINRDRDDRDDRDDQADLDKRGDQAGRGDSADLDERDRDALADRDESDESDERDERDALAEREERDGSDGGWGARASAAEVLRGKDFATLTNDERTESAGLMRDLRVLGAPRASRRRRPSRRGRRGRVDLARTMRAARRHEGEVFAWHTTRAATRPRPVVLLLDISGSMEPYGRAMLRLAHVSVSHRGRTRVEVFTLGTRLTRITRQLADHDADTALKRVAATVDDWSGGTRLGQNLGRFNDGWGARGVARGATAVIVSDGWERGDPAALAHEMQRLERAAFRIVWVNPLKASPGYQPLARGMAAALPHIDQFVEGHSLNALDEVLAAIARGDTERVARR